MSKHEFKVGQTVYAAKAKDDGTTATHHRFGYNKKMDHFAQGNVKGVIVEIVDHEVRVDTGNGEWSYTARELSKTPRTKLGITTKAAARTQKVLAKAPKKVYAVLQGERVFTAKTREEARERKAKLGGKAAGAIIVVYTPLQEIR